MVQFTRKLFEASNFSLAFEQMCNFAAIAKTRNADETLRELILQCFVAFPDERLQDAAQLAEAISAFGLQIPEYQVEVGLKHLLVEGRLQYSAGSNLALPNGNRAELKERIDETRALEERVKRAWLENIANRFPSLPPEQVWKGLHSYLSRTFRCHGLQAAALLDSSVSVAPIYSESLFSLLNESLKETFPPELRAAARDAILSFFADLKNHPNQEAYIEQLEAGVFNYFSLMVDPETAIRLRKNLNRITIFLDTNFLFNILDIGDNYYLEVSKDLIEIINRYSLPFKLRYHQATEMEMHEAIANREADLRAQERVQEQSKYSNFSPVSHQGDSGRSQRNGVTPIGADSFRKRYEHEDVLLREKNIDVYRSHRGQRSQLERQRERGELLEQYRQFLLSRGREKARVLLEHDITLLDTVHQMQSKAKTSLETGALLITCDYLLYRFDCEISQQQNRVACTVLPDIFLQVLQPFVPSSIDFDQTFKETFVIPEFRAIESKSREARSQLLNYLRAYDSLKEETAMQLLSNDLLLEPLHSPEDEHFHKYLESVIQDQRADVLLEEKAAVEKQLEQERVEKEAIQKKLEQERLLYQTEKARADKAEQLLRQRQKESTSSLKRQMSNSGQNIEEINLARQAKEEAENRAKEEILARIKAERKVERYMLIMTIMVGIFLVGLFEFFVFMFKWSHPHSTGLQLAVDIFIGFVTVGTFHPKLRSACWGVGAIAVLAVILQFLG